MSSRPPNDAAAEKRLLIALAAVQFVCVSDFVIVSPLGPVLMRTFDVGPTQLGALVSAYTFSAAVAGFAGALFVDRFDRRQLLLVLFAVFALALLAASAAPSYPTLMAARVLGGAVGGLAGATVYTIIGDVVPESRRGAATGVVMTAFAVATVAGVPIGLLFAGWFGWHAPFLALALLAVLVGGYARRVLPRIDAHLRPASPDSHPVLDALRPIGQVLRNANHLRAYLFVVLLSFSAFMVIPYIAVYTTSNVGVTERQLPLIYLAGGAATLFTARLIGRLADRHGHKRVYRAVAAASIVPLLLTTHLPPVAFGWALLVAVLFFVIVSGRMVPGNAIITGCAVPRLRGTFMSLNASIQSLAQAAATFLAGLIIGRGADGRLEHFGTVGWCGVAATIAAMLWVRWLRPGVEPATESVARPEVDSGARTP